MHVNQTSYNMYIVKSEINKHKYLHKFAVKAQKMLNYSRMQLLNYMADSGYININIKNVFHDS